MSMHSKYHIILGKNQYNIMNDWLYFSIINSLFFDMILEKL